MTDTLYKLTDKDGYTQRGTLWLPGEWHEVVWGGELCRAGCLHAYRDPLLAVLLDPTHGRFLPDAILWSAEGNVRIEDGTKVGCDRLRVVAPHDVPEVTVAQRVRWAILCVRYTAWAADPVWRKWAAEWLDSTDRSFVAADASADAAAATAASAAADAADAANAANAAYAATANAAYAAYAATYAATAAAADAAYAATYAATAAAASVNAAANAAPPLAPATVLDCAIRALLEE